MRKILLVLMFFLVLARSSIAEEYKSTYHEIKWNSAGVDNDYCIDITDENFFIYPGLQAVSCGKNLLSFSPVDYVSSVLHGYLPKGFTFGWRVWSKNTSGETRYGGNGYEGRVIIGEEAKILTGDVIENFRRNYFDNNYFSVLIKDAPDSAGQGCTSNSSFSRPDLENKIKDKGGVILKSTENEFCALLNGTRSCMKQYSLAIISSEYNGSFGRIRIFMTSLFDDKITEVDVNTQDTEPRIYAINKDGSALYNGKCNYGKLNGYAVTAINGAWTGYKLEYSKDKDSAQTSYASIKCVDQKCGLLTNSGLYTLQLSEFNLSTAWTTKKGALEIAGAVLSNDRNLLSLFFCKAPLSEANVLDTCSFFSFKRT